MLGLSGSDMGGVEEMDDAWRLGKFRDGFFDTIELLVGHFRINLSLDRGDQELVFI